MNLDINHVKFLTRIIIYLVILSSAKISAKELTLENILREAALVNGLTPVETTHLEQDPILVEIGEALFESTALSLNDDISCQTCHLDEFGSADGIPNAVGVGGKGEGIERGLHGGAIVPRNTLPFWGRGGKGFDVFFWDGKVDFKNKQKISQFETLHPSNDPLITAIHLPPLEIREMIIEDNFISENKTEEVSNAEVVYEALLKSIRLNEKSTVSALASYFNIQTSELKFIHIAHALSSFIRDNFKLRETRFHEFVFNGQKLDESELKGGLIFYGKGKCSVCHSGAYFTDFEFHNIVLPQIGFGKNGFGVDYGRFNVTTNPKDLYKFRTPPLYNVTKTRPYGHSGSVNELADVITYHFDPLVAYDTDTMSQFDRNELFKRIASIDTTSQIGYLDETEISDVVNFLKTLDFDIAK